MGTDTGRDGTGPQAAGLQRFLAGARRLGLQIEVAERPRARGLHEAAQLLGIGPEDIVKSLVVRHKDGSFLFALVPGGRQISWPKLRALLNVNKLSLPTAEVAFEATGYRRGTITPVGSTTAWPVYADAGIAGRRISLGAGDHGYSAFVAADELIAALGAVVADISDPE
ncbi:aminoacyl-tRNA deacylase [Arthrobacter sp. GCM10027362]|uniref:aminoacyl-tRNA deacylase n=1 Tax=Arthrobacter sp. GCM10027362 TaxID=3273379 RepID=UPI00363D4E20